MRILHTADWHLGSGLGGHDRTDELFQQVKQVCEIARQNDVEVLLVAGDVFEKGYKALPELTKKLAEVLAPYIRGGLHIILVPGNHDDRDHFNMMNALLTLEQGHSDKVHVFKTRNTIEINGVQFAAIPYPAYEILQPDQSKLRDTTKRHVSLSEAYADLVRSAADSLDPSLPAVFIAHISVAGVSTSSRHELSYADGLSLGRGDLPIAPSLKYIAMGHIHQWQPIDHPIPCYYSGSIARMDRGESGDENKKKVILVDISDEGDAKLTHIDLETTPVYTLETTTSQLDDLPSLYPDLKYSFVTFQVRNDNGMDPASVYRIIREICPRCRIGPIMDANSIVHPALALHSKSYVETVHGYLAQRYKDDPDLPELEKMTNQLLAEVENDNSTN